MRRRAKVLNNGGGKSGVILIRVGVRPRYDILCLMIALWWPVSVAKIGMKIPISVK